MVNHEFAGFGYTTQDASLSTSLRLVEVQFAWQSRKRQVSARGIGQLSANQPQVKRNVAAAVVTIRQSASVRYAPVASAN